MTPLFTLTTPNGKTIEGYECTCNIFSSDVECPNPTECALFEDSIVGIKLKLSDITEEQAKKWGYEEKDLSEMEDDLFFTAKDMLVVAVTNEVKVTEIDLSNILLILIEE